MQILYNVWGKGDTTSPLGPFVDSEPGAWYENALNWAYGKELISGYSAAIFGPNNPLTREQMAVLILRAAEEFEINLTETKAKTTFSDEKDIASWAYDAVYAMQKAGIIGGRPDDSFDPQGTLPRAEMAKVMYYTLELAARIKDAYLEN